MPRSFLVLVVALTLSTTPWMCATVCAQTPAPRNVLALHWSSEDFPTSQEIDAAIRQVLHSGANTPVDYYAEYLESDRFPAPMVETALRDYVKAKYQGRRIDVVIAVSEVVLQFALRYRAELFPDAPIVYSGILPVDPAVRSASPGITGIVQGERYAETLDVALKLHPSTQRVFVIAQARNFALRDSVRSLLAELAGRVEIIDLNEPSVPRLLDAVRSLPERSLVLFVRYSQEEPGHVLFPSAVAHLVADVSRVPVYGVSDSYIGEGVIGGMVHSRRELGTRLAGMTERILAGTAARDIPIDTAPLLAAFDWRQMQRWGITASQLPAGAEIRFADPTGWQQYRWWILGAIGVVALQAVMIIALVLQRARRRAVEARDAALLHAVPDMMFLLTREGVYIDVHAPDERLLLAQPNDFIGKHIRDVLPADVATSTERVLARLTPGEPPTVLEYTLQTADGERHREARLVISQDNQVLSVVRDVTERKRTQEALRQSQARYALATSVAGVGVWDWDLTTNEVYVDPSLKAILGYSDQEITNNADDWARLIHPDDLETAQARARDHLEGRSPFYEIEHRMLHRDGSIRWFMVRGSAVWLDGRAARIIGTSTDVTERKKSDQALLDAQADLARVSRLTALGEFAASIAHEIRQPLTAITTNAKACLHWLGGPKPDLSEVREALDDVVDASMRADELIRRNRELFKHQRIQKTLIDINAVIKESTRLATMQLQGSHVTLTTSLALDLPPVPADRVELQQVLLNLIANGIDAMDAVEPALRVLDVSSSQTADGFVKISVKDSGVGLSGVDRERMFSLSYTTKPSGTGVGLSVSRAIVEAHGGRLWAEQNAGLGATFYFTVPAQSTIAAA